MGRDSDWVRFLPLIVLIAVAVIGWRSRSALTRTGAVAVGLIIGGAVGNIVDRATRVEPGGGFFSGGVVDFIDLQWWPVFNVADMGVVIGGILFALVAAGAPPGPPDEPPAADEGGGAEAEAPGSEPVTAPEPSSGPPGGDGGKAGGGSEPIGRLADADTAS
jgi:signal peptidase II